MKKLRKARPLGEELKRSAKAVERSTGRVARTASRRTVLAGDRTLLAAERTYAAWVRTALTSLASGIGARALLADLIPLWLARLTGSVLILFAALCLVAAIWRHLNDGVPPPRPDLRSAPHSLLLAINIFLLVVCIAALIGVWTV